MDESGPRKRKVFVLGRRAALDVETVARRVVAEGVELVLLSLGFPVSAAQAAVVGDALRLADELRLWLDTALLTTPDQLGEFVRPDDEVTILASGRERTRLERAFRSKIGRSHVHATIGSGPRSSAHARMQAQVPTSSTSARATAAHVAVSSAPSAADRGEDETEPVYEGAMGETGSESVEALAGRQVAQPVIDPVWTRDEAEAKKRAPFRVYLGAAPGVGKTYAMLGEGQRRRSRGTDVVVGVVETYDRPRTIEILADLEIVPPRKIEYRGVSFEEMDPQAVIVRAPEAALIDELAHTNIPGSSRAKRWEDVLDILAEGITVITTLNVQHIASVNDVVADITGIRQQETVPDWVLDLADDVELVDISPSALQRRMMHGNVYPDPRKAELALNRFFTTDNLTALRELALMRVANRVDDALMARWSKDRSPETRERILVCVSRPGVAEELIGRGGRIAQRTGGELLVLHVSTGEQEPDHRWLERIRRLVDDLAGEFHVVRAEDPVESVLSFAYQRNVTQILVGESLRSRWKELVRGSFVNQLIRKASSVDIHVIARGER
jgi:nucleotide-binding universal stress UspA family protein